MSDMDDIRKRGTELIRDAEKVSQEVRSAEMEQKEKEERLEEERAEALKNSETRRFDAERLFREEEALRQEHLEAGYANEKQTEQKQVKEERVKEEQDKEEQDKEEQDKEELVKEGRVKAVSEEDKEEEENKEEDEDDDDEMEPKEKLIQILVSTGLLIAAYLVNRALPDLKMWQRLLIYLVPYLASGFDVLREAGEGISHGEVFDESFLMSVATIGALLIGFVPGGDPMFPEAVFVMLFFQVGELFEGIAEGNSRKAISQLLDIRPDSANLECNGEIKTVSPEEVKIGDILVVKPGEKVPVDGIVVEGTSSLDTVALTGESAPRDVRTGDMILSGCVNQNGLLRMKVEKEFGESTASKILKLVENAGSKKSKSEKFITKFA